MRITVSVHFTCYIYTEEAFIKIQMGINYSGGPSYAEIVNVCVRSAYMYKVFCAFTACIYIHHTATHAPI